MNRFLSLYALCATLLLVAGWRRHRTEVRRLRDNQEVLASDIERYRNRLGEECAASEALRLRCAEFERLRADEAERLRRLGARLRRLESFSKSTLQSEVEAAAPLHGTLPPARDSAVVALAAPVRTFRWHDPWTEIEGRIGRDSVHCRVRSRDTLRQTVYRIPRRFLFIRWGTRALRQEIASSNPHTQIVYTEYIRLERR